MTHPRRHDQERAAADLRNRMLATLNLQSPIQHEDEFAALMGMPREATGGTMANGGDLAQERQAQITTQSP